MTGPSTRNCYNVAFDCIDRLMFRPVALFRIVSSGKLMITGGTSIQITESVGYYPTGIIGGGN